MASVFLWRECWYCLVITNRNWINYTYISKCFFFAFFLPPGHLVNLKSNRFGNCIFQMSTSKTLLISQFQIHIQLENQHCETAIVMTPLGAIPNWGHPCHDQLMTSQAQNGWKRNMSPCYCSTCDMSLRLHLSWVFKQPVRTGCSLLQLLLHETPRHVLPYISKCTHKYIP